MKTLRNLLLKIRKEILEVVDMFVLIYVSAIIGGRRTFEKVPNGLKESVKKELIAQLGEEDATPFLGIASDKEE